VFFGSENICQIALAVGKGQEAYRLLFSDILKIGMIYGKNQYIIEKYMSIYYI